MSVCAYNTVQCMKRSHLHVLQILQCTFGIAAFIAICCVFDIAEESDFNALNRTKKSTSFLICMMCTCLQYMNLLYGVMHLQSSFKKEFEKALSLHYIITSPMEHLQFGSQNNNDIGSFPRKGT